MVEEEECVAAGAACVLVSEDGGGALDVFPRLKHSQRPAPHPSKTCSGNKGINGLTLGFLTCPSLRY